MSHIEEFRAAMRAAGIAYDGELRDDGKLHRIAHSGRKDDSGFYVLHPPNPIAGGHFGCWAVLPGGQNWSQPNGAGRPPQEMAALKRQWGEAQRQRQRDDEERHARFAKVAADYFKGLKPPVFNHGYFQSKQVIAYGPIVEDNRGDLALPLMDVTGKIWSYQTIDSQGDKLFMPGGRVTGCFFPVCDRADGPLVICEGYATGATIHEATGYATFCAMNCGNLLAVAKACREQWTDRTILLAADNDRFTTKAGQPCNPGIEHGKQAATAIKAVLVIPEFPPDSKGSDFNDLDQISRDLVIAAFEKAYPCPLSVMSFDQISKIPTSPADRLFGDHLLDRGSNLVILGQGGTGKTRLAYQMIASPHMGLDKFLTIQIHPGARNFRWLVLQAENGVERLKAERDTLMKMLGPAYAKFNEFTRVLVPINENDAFLNLDNLENVWRIQKTIEHANPDGVMWDCLYDFGVDDLNKDSGMKATLTAMTRLTRHRNPKRPLIVLHHAATGSLGAAKAIGYDRSAFARNSKVISNWARAIINLAPASEETNSQLVVSCGKCSNGKEFQPFAVKLNEESMRYEIDSDVDVAEWCREKSGKTAPAISPDEIVNLTSSSGTSKPDLAKQISQTIGCTRESAYRHIRSAIHKSKIRQSGSFIFPNSPQ